jgi:1-acyl-sn-glycerol-3-phosphate acyltransferase
MFPFTVFIRVVSFPFDKEGIMVHWWLTIQGIVITRVNMLWSIRIEGRNKAKPCETYVIISNHQSMLDILLITSLRYRLRWVSKIEIFRVPLLGWSMKMACYIPIDRGNSESKAIMMGKSLTSLQKGISVMLFPEGTRSIDGVMRDFKKGAFQMAIETKRPILPVVLDGTGKVLPRKGFIFSGSHPLRVRVLDPISPENFGTTDPVVLAEKLKNIIESDLQKMRNENEHILQ